MAVAPGFWVHISPYRGARIWLLFPGRQKKQVTDCLESMGASGGDIRACCVLFRNMTLLTAIRRFRKAPVGREDEDESLICWGLGFQNTVLLFPGKVAAHRRAGSWYQEGKRAVHCFDARDGARKRRVGANRLGTSTAGPGRLIRCAQLQNKADSLP